ncbi:hypothetical protein [Actinomadura atramentaria]|uniref:hypothetical protein n=1 Tax=Actinomadura atramentaria TaxID=1990 RepID=UPI000374C8E0|nr:hypothetical protein [Actinomadura atramentaria]
MNPSLIAASGTVAGPGVWFLLITVTAVGYIVHCVIWPYRSCRKCDGAGRFRSPSGRAWRYCNHCAGRGAQLRTGRRLWTYLKDVSGHTRRHR